MVGSCARDSPRCSKRTAVACVTAASTAAWDRPTETAALPRLNHGMMVSSFKPSPLPGLPSRSDSGTPRPCHPPATATPSVPASTTYRSLAPSPGASSGGVSEDTTYTSAYPAEVTQLLRTASRIACPSSFACETGAQKCEREPASDKARVASSSPEASRRSRSGRPGGGVAATAITADTCIRYTIAVEPHAAATWARTSANSSGPPPDPPASTGRVRPSRPQPRSASTAACGNTASASTCGALSRATFSTAAKASTSASRLWVLRRAWGQPHGQQPGPETEPERHGRAIAAEWIAVPANEQGLNDGRDKISRPRDHHQDPQPEPAGHRRQQAEDQNDQIPVMAQVDEPERTLQPAHRRAHQRDDAQHRSRSVQVRPRGHDSLANSFGSRSGARSHRPRRTPSRP